MSSCRYTSISKEFGVKDVFLALSIQLRHSNTSMQFPQTTYKNAGDTSELVIRRISNTMGQGFGNCPQGAEVQNALKQIANSYISFVKSQPIFHFRPV